MRTPNSKCSVCGKAYCRRPIFAQRYRAICTVCRKKEHRNFCSRACSNRNRVGSKYAKTGLLNKEAYRLHNLQTKYNVKHCMVEGCTYDKTYAEYHRKICKLEKINDYTLRAIYLDKNNLRS
jgi:hypothetical protein